MDRGWIVWGIGLVVVVVATWFVLSDRTKRSEPQNLPVGDVVSRDDSLTMRGPWDVVRSDPANAEAMASEEVRAPDRPAVGHGAEAEGVAPLADAAHHDESDSAEVTPPGNGMQAANPPAAVLVPIGDTRGNQDDAGVREPVRRQVLAFLEAKRLGQIDGTNSQWWRDRLIEAAAATPDDTLTAEAYFQAGLLSGHEPEVQEQLLRACAEHPLVEPTVRILALDQLARLSGYVRGDVVQAFADYNAIVETIERLEPPDLRESWLRHAHAVLLQKAQLLSARRGIGQSIPPLPPPDSGKDASDYYRAFLDLPADLRSRATPASEWVLLAAYADALAQEGESQNAARIYRELREHPQEGHTPLSVAYREAQALYPDEGPGFREALERAERELPRDSYSRSLSWNIAFLYYQEGFGRECIERVEPLLTSDDPDERAFAAKPNYRQNILSMLGDCYARPDVRDYGKAVAYYEQLLAEFPEYRHASIVYGQLARLFAYQVRDFQSAIYYCERFLSEFPDDVNGESVRRVLEFANEKAAAEAADAVEKKDGEQR